MNDGLKADIKELSFAAGIADTFHGRNCCAALDRVEEALTHAIEHMKRGNNLFNIGDFVEVSPNCEYYADWKGVILEVVGVYRERGISYQSENTPPPIRYSVKDIKDSWTYGFTDDFSFDDLALLPEPPQERND
jgi:hypothetical protein